MRENLLLRPDVTNESKIEALLHRAVEQTNALQGSDRQLHPSPGAALTGTAATWDSLAVVQFLMAVEDLVEDELGSYVALSDRAGELDVKTLGDLAAYIATELES